MCPRFIKITHNMVGQKEFQIFENDLELSRSDTRPRLFTRSMISDVFIDPRMYFENENKNIDISEELSKMFPF